MFTRSTRAIFALLRARLALIAFTIPPAIFTNAVGIELPLSHFLEEVIRIGYAEAVEGSCNIVDVLGLDETGVMKPAGNTVVKCARVNLHAFTTIM